jgi:hypothetical protein
MPADCPALVTLAPPLLVLATEYPDPVPVPAAEEGPRELSVIWDVPVPELPISPTIDCTRRLLTVRRPLELACYDEMHEGNNSNKCISSNE